MTRSLGCVVLLGILACAEAPAAAPEPGVLVVDVVSSTVAEGALLFTISGGPVDGVESGERTVTMRADESGTHLLLTGALVPGTIVRISVPDVSAARAYTVALEQVADGRTFALLDPASVSLRIGRAP